ncbi:hypothetical protein CRG96_20080 [Escherichia sp. E4930]|nr:hypothetical protein CRG96_20080 [Escherichia sp. E4930]
MSQIYQRTKYCFCDGGCKYKVDFNNIDFILLLFNALLFWLVKLVLSDAQLLSLNLTRILFLPPDGTVKIK